MTIINEANGLKYFEFESFQGLDVSVRVYTRHGGVSPAPWSALNQGGTVGDSRENVIENRKRIFDDIHRPVESIFDVWQVHGNQVIHSNTPRALTAEHQKADAILTDNPGITLFMRFADCVPIILFAPDKKVVSIVHAGWMGTVNGIVYDAVKLICTKYSIEPGSILAGIGPSIGPDHYQIGSDVEERVNLAFGARSNELLTSSDQGVFFNLWQANELLLRESGVGQIETAGICTACNVQDWYSHRQERGRTGRFAAVTFLK